MKRTHNNQTTSYSEDTGTTSDIIEFLAGRQFRRKELVTNAVLFFKDQVVSSSTLQVGEGGLSVTTWLPVKVGDEISIHFFIWRTYIRAKAEVRNLTPCEGQEKTQIVGLRFLSIVDTDRELLRTFAEGLTP